MSISSLQPLDRASDSRKRVGVKAARLVKLLHDTRGELPIAPTWVLDIEPFRDVVENVIPQGHDPRSLLRLSKARVRTERAARAYEKILQAPLPEALVEGLSEWLQFMLPNAPWGIAVRASPTCESQTEATLAGVSSVVLGVRDMPSLAQALRQVWGSVFFPHALATLEASETKDIAMAVVLQPVLVADASGQMITRSPSGVQLGPWRLGDRMFRVRAGLGFPNQRPELPADLFCVSRDGTETVRVIARKPTLSAIGESLEIRHNVDPEAPALLSHHIDYLLAIASKLERVEPGPWTVDFVRTGDSIHIISARVESAPHNKNSESVWSRANLGGLGQALPGVPVPLLWSVAAPGFDREFRQAFKALGCSVPRNVSLVKRVSGRLYVNLTEWIKAAAQVPGLDPKTLLNLSGGAGSDALERQVRTASHRGFFARLPLTATSLLSEQTRLGEATDRFDASIHRARRVFADMDLAILPDDALPPTLRDVRVLLERAGSLALSGSLALLTSHLALASLVNRSESVNTGLVALALSTGIEPLPTVLPTLDLLAVAHQVQLEPDAWRNLDSLLDDCIDSNRFLSSEKAIRTLPQGPSRGVLVRFFSSHEQRAFSEEDLTVPRWSEDCRGPLAMLRALRRLDRTVVEKPGRLLGRGRALADRELARLEGRLSFVERRLVKVLAERSQRFSMLRERLWIASSDALAMARIVAREINRRLMRVDPNCGPDGVFYCTHEELLQTLQTGRPDVAHLVRLRRAEQDRNVASGEPPPIFVHSPIPYTFPPSGDVVFRGMATGPGSGRGKARVLRDASPRLLANIQPGDVLVVRTLDLGMAPIFPLLSGIVCEQGGPLSHSFVVARAFGIPSVAHVASATLALRDGDDLRVDGDEGFVEKIRRLANHFKAHTRCFQAIDQPFAHCYCRCDNAVIRRQLIAIQRETQGRLCDHLCRLIVARVATTDLRQNSSAATRSSERHFKSRTSASFRRWAFSWCLPFQQQISCRFELRQGHKCTHSQHSRDHSCG